MGSKPGPGRTAFVFSSLTRSEGISYITSSLLASDASRLPRDARKDKVEAAHLKLPPVRRLEHERM